MIATLQPTTCRGARAAPLPRQPVLPCPAPTGAATSRAARRTGKTAPHGLPCQAVLDFGGCKGEGCRELPRNLLHPSLSQDINAGWRGLREMSKAGISPIDHIAHRCTELWDGPITVCEPFRNFEVLQMSGGSREIAVPDVVLYDPDTGLPRVILEVRVSKGTSLDPGLMQLILYGRQLMAPLPGHSHSAAAAAPGASAAAAPPGRVLQLALVSVVWNASADVLLSGLWESRCDTPDREHAALGATLRLQEEGRAPARARDVVFGEGVDVRMSDRVVGMDNAVPTREALRRADLRFRQW